MLPHWTQNNISIDGVPFHYYRTGDGSLPPLVLQHGFSDNGMCYSRTACDLEAQFDIIMPEAHGHGQSARIQPGDEFDLVADLVGIIQKLELNHPIVAGHSMGAMIASQLGARFPDLPRALILEDPPFWQVPPARMRESEEREPFDKWFRDMAALPLEEVIEQNRKLHPTWHEDVLHAASKGKKQLDLNFFTVGFGAPMGWKETVEAIKCPTLLLIGNPDKGGLTTPEVAKMAAEMNSNITVVHFPGAGHHIRFEEYAAYISAVKDFLKSLSE